MATEKYTYKFTQIAEAELDTIFDFISRNLPSPIAAKKLMAKIEKQIDRLAMFPFSASKCQNDDLHRQGYRKLIIENYIVFYLVDEDNKTVIISRIIFGRRQYEQLV